MTFSRGQIVLAFFPNAEGSGGKQRPALIVSTDAYNRSGTDITIAEITGNLTSVAKPGDYLIHRWEPSGLLRPCMLRARLVTIHERLVRRGLGTLDSGD